MSVADLDSLRAQIAEPSITMAFIKDAASEVELPKQHLFLTRMLRNRENARWWETSGRFGLRPEFVQEVDPLLRASGTTDYWDNIRAFIDPAW